MAKNASGPGIVIIAIIFLLLGWFSHQYLGTFINTIVHTAISTGETKLKDAEGGSIKKATEGEFCAKIITPAINPTTGNIEEFPTTCSVPEGWEVIENDVPGL